MRSMQANAVVVKAIKWTTSFIIEAYMQYRGASEGGFCGKERRCFELRIQIKL